MVYKDTGEVAANGSVEEHGSHTAVHTTGKSQDYLVVAQLCFQFCHCAFHKGVGTPVLAGMADVHHKVAEQLGALQGVVHLGVELYCPHGLGGRGISGIGDIGCGGNGLESLGNSRYGVAMAHPHL